MQSKLREQICLEQTNFVKALRGKSDLPDGFDQKRVFLAASILKRKRSKAVKKAWPKLSEILGSDFCTYFESYANNLSQPKYHSALIDGRLFVRYLKRNNLLSNQLDFEIERFDQKFFFKGKRIFVRSKMQLLIYRIGTLFSKRK